MPGVNVKTATRSGPSGTPRSASGQLFVTGQAERGSTTTATVLRGMADYEKWFGARVTYGALYDALKLFFDEGGSQAVVTRVVGPAATTGTRNLVDRAGSPVNTLKVDAASPGAWSSRVKVQVTDGAIPNTFTLIITLDDVEVERRSNLANPAAAVAAFAASPYVRVTNLGSATAAPTNNPAVAAATALSAGGDDRASITATHYTAALDKFDRGLGDGAVAIPGQASTVHAGLIAHAKANRRIAILAAAAGSSKSDYISLAAGLTDDAAGLFGPWVGVSDEAGGIRTVSPEGFVAACRARAHESEGAWRAPAGLLGLGRSILSLETEFNATDGNDLDTARVSVIRRVANSIRLYGWRSLSLDTANYSYLSARDLLNRLSVDGEARLEEFVFQTIDGRGHLQAKINASLVGMVEPIRQAGGLFEFVDANDELIDPGYKVETGSSVNTTESLAANEVNARLSVRVSPTGALVSLTIVKVGVTAGL